MRIDIRSDNVLEIQAETGIESYALSRWLNEHPEIELYGAINIVVGEYKKYNA